MGKKGESLFWADQLAESATTRKKFKYIDKGIKKPSKFIVKTSASISGVLHIGRLSDTIRGESVYRALKDSGVKAELIWVAEDMDPLRKLPKGIPPKFSQHIGAPVTDIPDPWGCHKTYAEHHVAEYTKVINEFVYTRMPRYSMREEYKKGSFNSHIKKMLDNIEAVKGILNKFRKQHLSDTWSPWQPICENCGKIMTPAVSRFEDGLIHYVCQDYRFEKTTAKGCGHKGTNDPFKGEGKLTWRGGEWASQWAKWKVVSEGAGKEYQVPGSAFWANGEIAERVLGYPEPVPIFYEHLIIDGQKMSASLGNVVYPKDWLEVAQPELLRFLYNKKLMKTRSLTWRGLPTLYNDYDRHMMVYSGRASSNNPKEERHMKRLYEISQLGKPVSYDAVPFDFAAMVSQQFNKNQFDMALRIFQKSGYISKPKKNDMELLKKRLDLARKWVELYGEEYRIKVADRLDKKALKKLSKAQRTALRELGETLSGKPVKEQELYNMFWEISKKHGITAPDFFRAAYGVLINKEQGPRLAPFMLAVGQERVAELLSRI